VERAAAKLPAFTEQSLPPRREAVVTISSGTLMSIGRRLLSNGIKLFDLLLMMVSFAVATLPQYHRVGRFSLAEFFEMRVKLGNLLLFVSFLLIWHM
jgi:hypothetical protein